MYDLNQELLNALACKAITCVCIRSRCFVIFIHSAVVWEIVNLIVSLALLQRMDTPAGR